MKIVYCHLSFRRPKNTGYGLFAVALYKDEEGKQLVAAKTRAYELWKDHQHITAVQAYEHALYCIWEWQSILKEKGVTNILLVTDNSTLAGWINNPNKNKDYTNYMNKANTAYKVGGKKELYLTIGLCEPRDYEKSKKFCKEEYVVNKDGLNKLKAKQRNLNTNNFGDRYKEGFKNKENKLNVGTNYQSIVDILQEEVPEGIELKEHKLKNEGNQGDSGKMYCIID